MSGVAFCVSGKIRNDLCTVNEVDSLTENQHIYSSLAFESQSETAPVSKIAEELLSITAFCLLKSTVGDHFGPFSSDKPKK